MKSSNVAKVFSCLVVLLLVLTVATGAKGDPTVADVTHWELQAVDEDGVGTYNPDDNTDKVVIAGIVLNNPEEILDTTPGAPALLGGQWQIYIQGEGDDHAGTAVWYGQNYAKVGGSGNYTDEELLDEMCRINRDPNTGYIFSAGDRVKVTGWYKFYKGKINVNEKHQIEPMFDFEVELVEPAVGLPQPEVIDLNDIKDTNELNFDEYLFDPNRGCDSNGVRDFNVPATGEYYQARLVRINDVNIIDPENWGPDNTVTITDANGLTFPVKLGIGDGFTRYGCPTGQIHVVAIFDQESSGTEVCKDGYRLWVVDYDGNGLVLTDRGRKRGNLPGDINADFKVDFIDFAEMAANWLECAPGLCNCD